MRLGRTLAELTNESPEIPARKRLDVDDNLAAGAAAKLQPVPGCRARSQTDADRDLVHIRKIDGTSVKEDARDQTVGFQADSHGGDPRRKDRVASGPDHDHDHRVAPWCAQG